MSTLKPDGEPEKQKNKALYGFIKKMCVTNKLPRNCSIVLKGNSPKSLKSSQNKADRLVAFSRGLLHKC